MRAIAAAALALGLVLGIAALAWAAPAVSIDSGPSGPTNDPLPVFGFNVDASATTVECSIDQGSASYGPCSGATTHAPDAPLPDGNYTFRVRATDDQQEQTEVTRAFTVDTTAPSLSVDSSPAGPTSNAMPVFGFTAELGATVECSIDQGSASFGPCSGATTHAPDAPLPDGDYIFRIQATDAAGNQATAARSFTVDTVAPSLSIDSGPAGATKDASPSFGFTAESGATVDCSVDQGSASYGPCSTGASHTASSLADGSYTFRVRATDDAGNQTVATRSFSVDATPPSLSIDSGPAGPTSDATPMFGFTAESGATVECSVDQGSASYGPCSGAATHQPAAPLPDGSYTFRVRATDAVGNRTTRTQAFSVDSSAPSLSIDSGPAGPTNGATPSFAFTAAAGATVECSLDVGTASYGPCTTATTYVVSRPLSEGSYTFRVRATNGLGTHAVSVQSFTVDTTPPSLAITLGPSGTTSDSTPLFRFTVESGASVECSIDHGSPAYGPCTGSGADAADAPLADGAYVFRVRATDLADNQTVASRVFVVDTAPPPTGTTTTPGPTPTTTATTPVTPPPTTTPSTPRLLSPFPIVRIAGSLTSRGVHIRLLSVRAPHGALVRVSVSPACGGKRHASRRCRVLQAAATVGRDDRVDFRKLAHAYRSGTVIVVRVWSADRIGKYTRFTIVRGKAPRRVDQCLLPGARSGSRCPSA